MIPEGTEDEARAIAALAESKLEELGSKRFGSAHGIPSGVWWEVHSLADGGFSAAQIVDVIDERIAEYQVDDPNDPYHKYQEWTENAR